MNQLALMKPTMTRVDLVFSYRSALIKLLKYCHATAYRHKIKSIVVILGMVAAHKTFGLYKSIKSALNPLADLQELADNNEEENNSNNGEGNGGEPHLGGDFLKKKTKN